MTEKGYRAMVTACIEQNKSDDMPYAEIARKTGQTPQNLNNKIRSGRVKAWELFQILEAMGVTVRFEKKHG